MKLLIVSAMYPPTRTGTSFYTKNLVEELKRNGHTVKVVTVKNDKKVKDTDETVYLKAIHLSMKKFFKHWSMTSFNPSNYYKLLRLAKTYKPHAIIQINHYLDIVFPAIFASRLTGIPLIVSIGTQLQSLNPRRYRVLKFLDRLICGCMVLPAASRIVAWDKEIERYVNETYKNKFDQRTVIIPFGVNGEMDLYNNNVHTYTLKKQIIGVGAVIEHRNYVFQIKVFHALLQRIPDMKLKIIGHIYFDEAIKLVKELKIEEHVVFTGELPHEKVIQELSQSDIHWMMLDGVYTGLGTATLEAMLLGLPIVSNIPEGLFGPGTLTDMVDYIGTDGTTIESIVDRLVEILESEEKREMIGISGKQFVESRMSWKDVGKGYGQLLEELR